MRRPRPQAAANGRAFPLIPDQAGDVQAGDVESRGVGEGGELNLRQLSYRWPNGSQALRNCNLTIPGPGLWMLVGSNGSGKSTLFRLIAGLVQAQSGTISTPHRVAMVFQNPDHQLLLPSCSSDLLLGLTNSSKPNDRIRCIDELLNQLGLSGLATRPIHTLSGGQKQRLAIAGALASDAGLLLLDEPTALLDPESQRTVLDAVQTLCQQRDQPLTALWITHRLEELDKADGAARMKDGRIEPWQDGRALRKRLQAARSGR